jgi:hypothetical protein
MATETQAFGLGAPQQLFFFLSPFHVMRKEEYKIKKQKVVLLLLRVHSGPHERKTDSRAGSCLRPDLLRYSPSLSLYL